MKNLKFTALFLAAIMMLASCGTMNNTGKGALIGGGGGAALGAGIGALIGKGKGAAIGAAVGAAVGSGAGALIGKKMDKQKAELEKIENAQKAIVRPEFLELAKKGELKRYMSAAEKGIVEDVIFSGSRLDVIVNINGIKVTAERSLEKDRVEVGEEVDVLIYRLYVFDDKETYLLENKEMQEGDVFYI